MGIFDTMMRYANKFKADSGVSDEEVEEAAEQSPREKELLAELAELSRQVPAGTGAEPVRYALRFTGEVQGVGFRWTNQSLAEEHGLTGWVENIYDDGSVKMQIQGPPAAIAAHLGRIHAYYSRYKNRIWIESYERIDVDPDEEEFRVTGAW